MLDGSKHENIDIVFRLREGTAFSYIEIYKYTLFKEIYYPTAAINTILIALT